MLPSASLSQRIIEKKCAHPPQNSHTKLKTPFPKASTPNEQNQNKNTGKQQSTAFGFAQSADWWKEM
jgi:hypothetical protein